MAQSSNGGTNITIQFKEFGVRLNFTPTLLSGDLIHLKVRPEVSALDFSNAITLQGFRIPALSTRRTETEVELRDGQTFAVAGLMNNTLTSTLSKIPGIGDIPILGLLFKSRAYQKNQTELVVMITPQILRANSTGAASKLPNLVEPYLPPQKKPVPPPAPYNPQGLVSPPPPAIAPARGVVAAPAPATGTPAASVVAPAAAPVAPPAQPAPSPAGKTAAKTPAPAGPSKAERKAAEKAASEQKKQLAREAKEREKKAREAAKKAAEQAKVDAKQAEKDREQEARLARERASREAELASKANEERRKQEEKEREHGKTLAEAEARLRAAQAAFQAEVNKSTSGSAASK